MEHKPTPWANRTIGAFSPHYWRTKERIGRTMRKVSMESALVAHPCANHTDWAESEILEQHLVRTNGALHFTLAQVMRIDQFKRDLIHI